jgi:hypothetical protein
MIAALSDSPVSTTEFPDASAHSRLLTPDPKFYWIRCWSVMAQPNAAYNRHSLRFDSALMLKSELKRRQ